MASDAAKTGWIVYCVSVFLPALIVFGIFGWVASKTRATPHIVFSVLAVGAWLIAAGLLIHGRNKYLKAGQ